MCPADAVEVVLCDYRLCAAKHYQKFQSIGKHIKRISTSLTLPLLHREPGAGVRAGDCDEDRACQGADDWGEVEMVTRSGRRSHPLRLQSVRK